jgi:hypothetical protein
MPGDDAQGLNKTTGNGIRGKILSSLQNALDKLLVWGGRMEYSRVKRYHPVVIAFYNDLFDTVLPPSELTFGGYLGSYLPREDRVNFGIPTLQDPDSLSAEHEEYMKFLKKHGVTSLGFALDTLCEEEGHRYHNHVNPYSVFHLSRSNPEKCNALKENFNAIAFYHMYNEGTVRYVKTLAFKELEFDNLSQAFEQFATVNYSTGKLDWRNVFVFLKDKDISYLKKFVRMNPFEAMIEASSYNEPIQSFIKEASKYVEIPAST